MIPERLIGPKGQIPVIIRDDDTSFFTEPRMLESIYSKVWQDGFKVSLSVVPSLRGRNDLSVPPDFRNTGQCYSIPDNKSLVAYLRDKIHHDRSIEILQHGFSHDYNNESCRWEYGDDSKRYSEMKCDTERGMKIIRQACDIGPRFFVSPGEDLSARNMRMIFELGMIPIYRQTIFDRFLRSSSLPYSMKKFAIKRVSAKYSTLKMEDQILVFMKPVTMSVGRNVLTWSTPRIRSSTDSFKSLVELTGDIIKKSFRDRTPVCILNHYHAYYYDWNSSITKHDRFRAWRYVFDSLEKLNNVWKVTFSQLYDRTESVQNTDIAKTGSKITIVAKSSIQDVSFRVRHNLEPDDRITKDEYTNIITVKQLIPNNKIVLYEKD